MSGDPSSSTPKEFPKALIDVCASCRQSSLKNGENCGLCGQRLCKACVQFVDPAAFSFLKNIPEDLVHGSYCMPCHSKKVAPALESYSEIMERAESVIVFYKNERNIPPHRRSNKMLSVRDCPDRKETLLRLAFFAAEQDCDALVSVALTSEKIRNAGYQKTSWSGTGFPTCIFVKK